MSTWTVLLWEPGTIWQLVKCRLMKGSNYPIILTAKRWTLMFPNWFLRLIKFYTLLRLTNLRDTLSTRGLYRNHTQTKSIMKVKFWRSTILRNRRNRRVWSKSQIIWFNSNSTSLMDPSQRGASSCLILWGIPERPKILKY